MQSKDKGDGIEDSPLDMLLVILLDGASKEVVMPSSDRMNLSGLECEACLVHFKGIKGESEWI